MEDDDDFDFLLQLAAAVDARDPKGLPALLVKDDDTILKEAYGGSIDRNEHSRQASQTATSSTSGAIQGNPSRTAGVKSHNITQADLLQRPKADSVCTQHVACYKEEISGLRVSLINRHSSLTSNTDPRPSVIDSTPHGRCLGPSWDRSWSGIASTTPAPS
jgi:hypothetical protein